MSSSLEGSMSLSLTVGFAAAILFGPAFAGVVAIGGVVISDLLISRRNWTRVVFNASQLTLSAGLRRSSTPSSRWWCPDARST